ncbi:MAG: DUF4384 domain-containing protein [Candidatus Cloacimonetes bacterium]|nr:DUF4384 domain-containing protein [Candidatus Cloacimonadota bacterium]
MILFTSCTNSKLVSNNDHIKIISNNEQNEFHDLGNGWFQVTETVTIENITPEKAKEIAIEKACKRAIEFYSGIEISGRVVGIQAENQDEILINNFSSITQQTSQGIITEKELLKDEIISKENQLLKVITIKLKVENQEGEKDPAFEITANLNREYFKNGEELELTVNSSKDCYLTILNICSNDSVYVLFPNNYRKDNFVKSGENFKLPNAEDKRIGLYFPVNLLPNKNEDFEIIKVIATKQKIDFSSVYSFSAYGTYQTALNDLQNWLLKIPRNEIEEIDLQYFIGR